MTFYILLSTTAILTTIVGCALIWGYDVVRAREIQQDPSRRAAAKPELAAAQARTELEARPAD